MISGRLMMDQWGGLGAGEREAAARVLGDMLLAAGFPLEFKALQKVSPYSPETLGIPAPTSTVAVFLDQRHGLEWVLVPGGVQRSWGDRERKLIKGALEAIDSWVLEEGEPMPRLEDVRPYGAAEFEFGSMFRSDANLAPFLTTPAPILGSTRSLPQFAPKRSRLLKLTPEPQVFTVHRDELEEILEPRGWALPDAHQSQWMTGAGQWIFPWGDTLPNWMVEGAGSFEHHFRFGSNRDGVDWARASAFGLVDALVASHWVLDGERLSWSGGSGECYPWQACGEWAGFITAAVVPEPVKTEPWVSHALRPIIELAPLM